MTSAATSNQADTLPLSLAQMAQEVLTTADGREKTALSRRHAAR